MGKTIQTIRAADVVLIAPLMIYAGSVKSNLPEPVKNGLLIFGWATLLYNGYNLLANTKI